MDLPLAGAFEYRIPARLRDKVEPGVRVWVSFSRRRMMGICFEVVDTPTVPNLLEIISVVEEKPLLSSNLIRLVRWMSDYYYCTLAEAALTALPRVARKGATGRKVQTAKLGMPPAEALVLAEELVEKRPKQARILRLLAESDKAFPVRDLCDRANVTRSPVDTLARQKKVVLEYSEPSEPPLIQEHEEFPKPERLSAEQEEAVQSITSSISDGEPCGYLLYGVTGSGKTEVYLRSIEEALSLGKGAIVLVPEISLTPQTIARFKGRFDRVAVLHSRLTDRERLSQWKMIQEGGADVVIGARSAVFAPMPNLGLIVVDEEHETSFKQQNVPHYHARDVALKRAEIEGAIAILGSATPSLEAFHLARTGKLKSLALRHRVGGRSFPGVSMVNMKYESAAKSPFFSTALTTAMTHTLKQKKQIILFLNRRGYFTVLLCGACEETVRCGNCDISLTLHRKANRLICHYCGHEQLPPASCPSCAMPKLRYIGAGTERVEHEVRSLFPRAVVLRMDSDTMIGRHAHETALGRFKEGEVDILVGTQMIAKGLDFPDVTLVGVIAADLPLYQPDFRAAERTYQLLSQVSGRAGRGEDIGRVIVQTLNAEHYSIQCAMKNDYFTFATQELETRKEAGYPPYVHLMRIVFTAKKPNVVEEAARLAAERIAGLGRSDAFRILGPARAPIARISGKHRWHLLLKSPLRSDLDRAAEALKALYRDLRRHSSGPIRMALDVDPLSML
ncbi:MAG: replication restart helicase PriA [Planctomycetota bacterium]